MARRPPRRNKENLREVDRAFIHAVMFQLGILPMEKVNNDMRIPLRQLPPEEARVLKRKFRKLWRKAMRAEVGNGPRTRQTREDSAKQKYGVGKNAASRQEKTARKQLVFDLLWNDHIEPMLKRFENPDNQDTEESKPKE